MNQPVTFVRRDRFGKTEYGVTVSRVKSHLAKSFLLKESEVPMNILGAIIAGVPGTIVISAVMAMAPMMGLPKMDISMIPFTLCV